MDDYKYVYDKYQVEIIQPTGSGGLPFGQLLKSVVETEDKTLLSKLCYFGEALDDYYVFPCSLSYRIELQ